MDTIGRNAMPFSAAMLFFCLAETLRVLWSVTP